jgi:hypothetical protein
MRNTFLLTCIFLHFISLSNADCYNPALVDNGATSANARVPSTRYRSAQSVYIITQAEMSANGYLNGDTIKGIGWKYSVAPGISGTGALNILLENSTDNLYSKSSNYNLATAGMVLVHTGNTLLPSTAGLVEINFSGGQPFIYSGGSIYVAFSWSYCSGTLSTTAIALCRTSLSGGIYSSQSTSSCTPSSTMAASSFRPATYFLKTLNSDAKVSYIYTKGKVSYVAENIQRVTALVSNVGNQTLNGLNVNLTITGANTFTDTKIISQLSPCQSVVVAFDSAIYNSLGSNVITVSVPSDENINNNSKAVLQSSTQLESSYEYAGDTTHIGYQNAGRIAVKFSTSVRIKIDKIFLSFNTTGQPFRLGILSAVNGFPGQLLYRDTVDRSTGPSLELSLENDLMIEPGEFFLEIIQLGSSNFGLSSIVENPVRTGTFFTSAPYPATTSWTDFALNANYKPNVGIKYFDLIPITSVSDSSLCVTDSISVTFTTVDSYNPSNVFTLQISDSSGNFNGAVSLASIQSIGGNTVSALIPPTLPFGMNYRLRVVANDPEVLGLPSTTSLTINTAPTISPSQDAYYCTGNPAILTASAASSYDWSTGDSTQSVFLNTAGTYSVSGPCGTSANVTVYEAPKPVIQAMEQFICLAIH